MIRYLAVLLIFLSACASHVNVDRPSHDLIEEGNEYYNSGKYKKAAQSYENAILNSDSPEDAQLAQRMLGESYFLNKDYVEAIAAYEVYYDYYFEDERDMPLVLYHLGMAYADLSMHPKRDQTFTARSVDYLDQLEAMYPAKFEELGAEKTREEMLNKLAEGDYQVGRYYYRQDKYESALRRFVYMMENFPDSPRYESALVYTVKSALEMDDGMETAVNFFEVLKGMYPENTDLKDLAEALDKKKAKESKEQ